jgi:hypothetical protein
MPCSEDDDDCILEDGWCYIWRTCYRDEMPNPENSCQWCDWLSNDGDWTNQPPRTPCDDSLWCNGDDTCDGFGECIHEGDPCSEECLPCNEAEDECILAEGSCYIDEVCYDAEEVNPDNECEWCDPASATEDWTARPDFTRCTLVTAPDRSYDICVQGTCVSPGCGEATCNAPGPNWTHPDTNQRACYDNSSTALGSCPGTAGACGGTAFCGQDAQYGWDTRNPASARFTRTATAEPVVTDNVNRLIWQGCAAGLTGSSCATGSSVRRNWSDALAYCESLSWGGATDWRLPDRFELQSIVDYGRTEPPAINTTAFPATPSSWHWSSSSSAGASSYAWYVHFYVGNVGTAGKSLADYVRCVRGGP